NPIESSSKYGMISSKKLDFGTWSGSKIRHRSPVACNKALFMLPAFALILLVLVTWTIPFSLQKSFKKASLASSHKKVVWGYLIFFMAKSVSVVISYGSPGK